MVNSSKLMKNEGSEQMISFAEFEIDAAHRRLLRHGEILPLNAKAFDLLVFLAENSGRIVTKDEILEAVWENQFVEEANLKVQISALRKVLGEPKEAPRFLVTVPGKGYKFVSDGDRKDHQIIIEKHKFERFTLYEKDDYPPSSGAKRLTPPTPSNRRMILLGLAFLIFFGLIGFKYFLSGPEKSNKFSRRASVC